MIFVYFYAGMILLNFLDIDGKIHDADIEVQHLRL